MANVKIPELTALASPSPSDLVPVADVSTANDEVKKTTVGEIVGIITGDVEVATDGTSTISELPVSKLQDGEARQLLQTAANGTDVEWTDDVDLPGTLDVTGVTTLDNALNVAGLASLDGGIDVDGAFTVANSTGDIATSGTLGVTGQSTLASAAISDLTGGRVVLAGASGEIEDNANLVFNGSELGITGTLDVSSNGTIGGNLTVVGDLTVEGATITLETETVVVEDKNIQLGVVSTPTDTTADGGGITLKGATDKTFNWLDATDSWTSSEHIDLASGKAYYIGGAETLSATALGSAVVSSSLTSVGTLTSGELGAGFTTISTAQGGTGQTTYADGELLIGKTDGTLAKATLTGGTGVDVTNADGSVTVAVDSTVVTTSDTGTVTSAMISDGTIANDDINASAAIAGTKINPDFGSQTVGTTGHLLVGTSTTLGQNELVQIAKSDAGDHFGIYSFDATAGGQPAEINLSRSKSDTIGTGAALAADDALGAINFRGYDGDNFSLAASITAVADGEFNTSGDPTDSPGRLVFSVTADAYALPAEALRISSDRSITVSDGGDVALGTTTGTKIGTATSQKIGFYNATPVVQPTAVADITTTATSGSLPTPDGSVTIADATTPTVTELLEYCVELEAKLEAALGHLRTLGLIAT